MEMGCSKSSGRVQRSGTSYSCWSASAQVQAGPSVTGQVKENP